VSKAIIIVALLATSIVPVAATASAGKSSTSISLVLFSAPALGTSRPSFGDQVTFNVSTTATDTPWVDARCYQGGTLVYEQWAGFYAGYPAGQTFTLGPTQMWTGGAANCTARLVEWTSKGTDKTLASVGFNVAG